MGLDNWSMVKITSKYSSSCSHVCHCYKVPTLVHKSNARTYTLIQA